MRRVMLAWLALMALLLAGGGRAYSQALVTDGLVLHLDSTQGVTISGNTVTSWADSSGNASNITAVGNPQRGTVLTPTGLTSIRLDGVDDKLERTGTLTGFPSGNADRTMFLVTKYNSSTWWAGVAYGTAASNQSFGLNVQRQQIGPNLVLHGYGFENDLASTTPGIGAGWMVQSGMVSSGTGTHFKDGTQVGQFTHTYNTILTKLVIGAEIGNLGYAGMDVAAVLIYNRALSAGERADVDAYLRSKYLVDITPPAVTVPANITAEATGGSGATVSFTTAATDIVNGSVATTNIPASGSVFPIGATTVTATAVDAAGNSASRTFTVAVRDTTAPIITVPVPGPLTHEAGAPFVDPGATATDAVAGVVPLTSSTPVNGLVPGIYVLTYNFTDVAGNAAAQKSITVNVVDTTASKSLSALLGPILAQAQNRTVRILMGGTSIASFGYSSNQVFASHLKALYGDARADVLRMGVINGSWELAVQGWYKQPYSGPSFVRLRGGSASLPLDTTGYGSQIVVEYSREADGGTCQVEIDDAPVGIINCNGPQTLSAKAVFTVPAGYHKVTFRPPGGGFVYLERLIFEQNRPGIEVIDGTLGGSGLINVYANFPRGAPSVPGIPTQPGVGVASYFQRPDIDAVIWSGPVNDVGGGNNVNFATWAQRMDEIVAVTGTPIALGGGVVLPARPLILIAEMGGHMAMPASPYHAAFLQRYEYLRELGKEHRHVYTVNWHGATFDPDIQRYAANYYTTGQPVVVNPVTGFFSGDFIHPNIPANRIALQLLCSSMGIPIPIESAAGNVENRIRKTSPVPPGTSIAFLEGGIARSERTSELGASVFVGQSYASTLPLVFSGEVANLTDVNNQIAASANADKFGKYLSYPSEYGIPIFDQVNVGERVTVTALIKPDSPGTPVQFKSPGNAPGVMYYGDSILPGTNTVLYDPDEPPMWVTFDYRRGGHTSMIVTGRLYSISVTRTNGQPVSTVRPSYNLLASVTTQAASAITSSAAKVHGVAMPNHDGAISVSFDYGTSPELTDAASTLNSIVSSDDPATTVSQQLAGLSAQTVYFFRVKAMMTGNPTPVLGQILSFTTPEGPSRVPLLSIAGRSMKLRGQPGQVYTVEASGNLNQWETINVGVLSLWGAVELADVCAAECLQRFYRIRHPSP